MNPRSAWFLPLAVVVACIPCLLIPIFAALIAAGALGGALGFLGVPWVLALAFSIPLGGALLYLRLRSRPPAC